ncbi:MAG: hypothetical protein MK101_00485 [Phycisphaerales bacterium]|nr:hypothetical protein [Phycisphaerales bacterium]
MNADQLRLGYSFAGSILVNTLIVAPAAVVAFTAQPSAAISPDASHDLALELPPPDDEIDLGIDESDASTLTWVGYEEYMEHVARQAEFEQAQLQAAQGENAAGQPEAAPQSQPQQEQAQPVQPQPEPVPPTEPAPTTTPQPPSPDATDEPEPSQDSPQTQGTPAEAPPDTTPPASVGLPVAAEATNAGFEPDQPGVPQVGRETPESGEHLPSETPELQPEPDPGQETSEPTPVRPVETTRPAAQPAPEHPAEPSPTEPSPAEPSPVEPRPAEPEPVEPRPTEPQPTESSEATPPAPQPTTPSPTPTQATSEPDKTKPQGVKGIDDAPLRLDGSDRDADATSLVKVSRRNLNLGRPVAREGLKLFPRKPDFTSLQVVSSGGKRGVLARLVFKSSGRRRSGRLLPSEAYIGREILSGPDKGTVQWFNDSQRFDRLEQSIHTALFSWTAEGRKVDEIEEGKPVIINLELQIAVR